MLAVGNDFFAKTASATVHFKRVCVLHVCLLILMVFRALKPVLERLCCQHGQAGVCPACLLLAFATSCMAKMSSAPVWGTQLRPPSLNTSQLSFHCLNKYQQKYQQILLLHVFLMSFLCLIISFTPLSFFLSSKPHNGLMGVSLGV